MKLGFVVLSSVIAALGNGLGGSAQAGVVWYGDRSAWATAAGTASFTEDFSSFTGYHPFRSAAVALNGMSIGQEGINATTSGFRNLIQIPAGGIAGNNGTAHASMFTDFGFTTVRISFASLNGAFGGESWGAASTEVAEMAIFDGTRQLSSRSMSNGSGDFLGYVLTDGDTASSVLFRSANNDGNAGEVFGLDNLVGVNAGAVPEPGALALVGVALAALALARRRQA